MVSHAAMFHPAAAITWRYMDYLEWRAAELSNSPAFDRALFTLRKEAHRDRRKSHRFADMTLPEIREHIERSRSAPRMNWHKAAEPPPNQSADAMLRYLMSCDATAGRFLGATSAATVIHAAACATGPVIIEPVGTSACRAPTGGTASSAAAALTGEDWKTPSARRVALHRATPRDRSGFVYRASVGGPGRRTVA